MLKKRGVGKAKYVKDTIGKGCRLRSSFRGFAMEELLSVGMGGVIEDVERVYSPNTTHA